MVSRVGAARNEEPVFLEMNYFWPVLLELKFFE